MKSLKIAFILITFAIANLSIGQKIDTEKLNQYFDSLSVNDRFMGSVAILKDNDIVYKRSVGYIELQSHKKGQYAPTRTTSR